MGCLFSIKPSKPQAKLAAIPTTAGSGAEVTSNAVIYINGIKIFIKILIRYFKIIPYLFFIFRVLAFHHNVPVLRGHVTYGIKMVKAGMMGQVSYSKP